MDALLDGQLVARITLSHNDFVMRNHHVHGVSMLPGVTFLDLLSRMLAARGVDLDRVALTDVLFTEPVTTEPGLDKELLVTIAAAAGGARQVEVASRPVRPGGEEPWRRNAAATLRQAEPAEPAELDVKRLKETATQTRDLAEIYQQARQEHIVHGPPMRCRGTIYQGPDGLLAELDLDPVAASTAAGFHLHPALMDASTMVAFARTPLLGEPFIPISIAEARVGAAVRDRCHVYVPAEEVVAGSGDVMHNDYRVYGADGRFAVALNRLACKRIRTPQVITARSPADRGARRGTSAAGPAVGSGEPMTEVLRRMVGDALSVEAGSVSISAGFYDLGLDSLALLRLGELLEPVVGARIYPTLLFEFGDIESLAAHLTHTYGPPRRSTPPAPADIGGELRAYRRRWRSAPPVLAAAPRLVILLSEDERGARAVAAAMAAPGREVHCARPERLAGLLRAEKPAGPMGFVLLLDDDPGADPGTGYAACSAVASALAGAALLAGTPVLLVAGGGPRPEHAALGALARTMSAETPELRYRFVGMVDTAPDPVELAGVVAAELAEPDGRPEVRYRAGSREVAELVPLDLEPAARDPIRRNGVYLVTGGAGGIGTLLADHLARRYQARLLLVGRGHGDALVPALAGWRAFGAEAEYLRADVADPAAAAAAVEHARLVYGRLNGVFHLAGLLHDAVYFRRDPDRTAAVLRPKLRGAANLDESTVDDQLDLFVLFSSLSAVLANPGQGDYAYANAFLGEFAERRSANRGRTLAIDWPYWSEGGMRLPGDAVAEGLEPTGLLPLPTVTALDALHACLRTGEPRISLAYGDPDRLDAAVGAAPTRRADTPSARVEPRRQPLTTATGGRQIAVIGMAGRYPQAPDLAAFWRNLRDGRDCVTEIPADRWDHARYFDPRRGIPGKTYSRWGGFLDGVAEFPRSFFGVSRREAEWMDPQERLFLTICWQALEAAGYPPESLGGERAGVFAGVMWNHYQLVESADRVAPTALHSSVANRVSHVLGLTGPSMAVDTACSSSLIALHLAAESIRAGESTMAIAGGVNVTVHPQKYLQLALDQFLSDDGRCRAFGAGGTGYVPGEGVGAVVLKPLDRALADGDHVAAVLIGSAVNHSGRTSGFTVPDPAAQAELITTAMAMAGAAPETISYIEAHGAGTSLGDPIEIEGLRRAFASAELPAGSCAIGSAKTNIGHLESAAGIAAVTKVVLQLEHGELVPSLHADKLNPQIPFDGLPFAVQRTRKPWRARASGIPLRAGVSAFGAGGANAHVILQAAPQPAPRDGDDPGPELVVLSALTEDGLAELAAALAEQVGTGHGAAPLALLAERLGVPVTDVDPSATLGDLGLDAAGIARLCAEAGIAVAGIDLDTEVGTLAHITVADRHALRDVAYTSQVGRRAMAARLAVVAGDLAQLRAGLVAFTETGAGMRGTVTEPSTVDDECAELFAARRFDAVGRRWVAGAAVDWAAGWRARAAEPAPRRVPFPATPLRHERCWIGGWASRQPRPESQPAGAHVLRILDGGIALITMADRANHNVFTDELLDFVGASFTAVADRDDIKAVVITGTEREFCLGGAPDALTELAGKNATFTEASVVYEGMLRCPKPVVAAMRGDASGGGLAFGLYADMVVMSRDGSYSANFVKFGFTPGMGASYVLEYRLGAALATEMMLTGRAYSGTELERRGGQVLFESADAVLPTALDLANSIAGMPQPAVRALKAELAGRVLDRLAPVIEREVAMHDRVLDAGTVELVQQRFRGPAAVAEPVAVRPAADPAGAAPEPSEVVGEIERGLAAQLYLEPHELDHGRSFSDQGLDSIGAVQLVRGLNQRFGVDLDSVVLYDHPTVPELAQAVRTAAARRAELHLAATGPAPAPPAAAGPLEPDGGVRLPPLDAGQPAPQAPPATGVQLPDLVHGGQPVQHGLSIANAEIAVIGMSGRFPDADDLTSFWDNLCAGRSATSEVPRDRWDPPAAGRHWAALLSDWDGFDHRFFAMSPLEAELTDPQQRLFLTEAWKALEDAGYAGTAGTGSRCGVFAGCATGDYSRMLERAGRLDDGLAFLGTSSSILAARIGYLLDLHGPAVAVDTACSSSLVAVHLAAQSLRAGEADIAIAGGVALMLTPSLHERSARVGMLSPTGTSAPFDAAADGIVLGEGVGVVVLKRLADALADGDAVHAVITASGVNGDGHSNGITAPSATAQAELLRRVHRQAGVAPGDIGYVEAHGTGTALGDPIEVKALNQVLAGSRGCRLGSVKANIGHTTMAAGVASLLKLVLSLRHKQLPPTPGFRRPNPEIDFTGGPLSVVRELTPWPAGPSGRRVGAVSSFGFSGTNCHLVVREPDPVPPRQSRPAGAELVAVSAESDAGLDAALRRLVAAVTAEHQLADVAFTLGTGRRHLRARAAIVAKDIDDLHGKLTAMAAGTVPDGCARGTASPRPAGQAGPDPGSGPSGLAAAYVGGAELDWPGLFAGREVRRVSLPASPLAGTPHRIPPAAESDVDPEAESEVDSSGWRGDVLALHPAHELVADHQIGGRPLLPGAATVQLAVARAGQAGFEVPLALSALRWVRPFEVAHERRLAVQLTGRGGGLDVRLADADQPDGPHATATLERLAGQPDPVDLDRARAACGRRLDMAELYAGFDAAGLRYGPAFRLLSSVVAGADEAVGALAPFTTADVVPAAVLDAAFQSVAALVGGDPTPLVPVGATRVEVYRPLAAARHVLARRTGRQRFDVDITDPNGGLLLRVVGLALSAVDPLRGKVFRPVWRPTEVTRSTVRAAGRTLVTFAQGAGELAARLAGAAAASEAVVLPWDGAELSGLLARPFDTVYLVAGADTPARSGVLALLRVVQAMTAAGHAAHRCTITVVTDRATSTVDEPVAPGGAALHGMAGAVAAEYPAWRVGCVDVRLDEPGADLAGLTGLIAADDATERLVALRGQDRLVRTFEPALLPAGSPWRRGGVYLLLGGAGGIGYALSRHLAAVAGARLVWLGRRAEDGNIAAMAAEVAALGGEVCYLRADAADPAAVGAAVAEAVRRFGPINGAVHTAMVQRDRALANLTESDVDDVLATKVAGVANLAHALSDQPLDFLVLFSSAASFVDSAGQGNYAAASTFLDAYGISLRRAGVPVTVLNWGYWGSVGAVADDFHRARMAEDGVGSVEPAIGFAALERAINAGAEQLLVIEAEPRGLAPFGIGAPAAAPPVAAPRPDSAGVTGYLLRVFTEVLKFGEGELDDMTTFDQYGIDSVVNASLMARLERDLGPLPATLLFEENSIDRLAARLLAGHGAQLAAVTARAARASVTVTEGAAEPGPSGSSPSAPAADGPAPIAVIGVSGRYPRAGDLAGFWRQLIDGRSGITEVPADRWDWRDHGDGYHRWGGFLDRVDEFDAGLFGILPRDAADIDPQERLFLETCSVLLDETGYLGQSHEPATGVFAGLMYGTYGELGAAEWAMGNRTGAHSAYWSVANRVSYTFDLAGPSMAVDSACSSSLTAVHLACESIRRGECAMAIAGGVNLILHPAHFAALGARNMLAPDGAVKVFDSSADGYVPGEGVGAVLLKPLPAAVADRDDIWAVIRASSVNAGGRTTGYTVPNPNAQAELITGALRGAGVHPGTVSYFEAHGSGTSLGDPIEVAALARAFGSAVGTRCAIGSVKSNIGHLEGAAGIAGLTKVLLQLRHRMLVPTINLDRVNPKIDFAGTPFLPQRTAQPWHRPAADVGDGMRQHPLRAGVSSFGAGGANAHVVVEEYRAAPAPAPEHPGREQIVLLSAPDRARLAAHAAAVADFAESAPAGTLPRLAFTSQVGRRAFDARVAVLATDLPDLAAALRSFCAGAADPRLRTGADAGDPPGVWVAGSTVDWLAQWPQPGPGRIAYPPTPFDRRRYWIRSRGQQLGTEVRYERAEWSPAPPGGSAGPSGTVLVVSTSDSLATVTAAELRRRGHTVVTGAGATGADALVWIDDSVLDGAAQGWVCQRVLEIATRLGARARLLCVRIGQSSARQPHLEALSGLLKSIVAEQPGRSAASMAVDPDDAGVLAVRIADELQCGAESDVAYRDGTRLALRMREFQPPAATPGWVRPDGGYLITGGAGGLGRVFARLLAERGAAAVMLAGRTDQSTVDSGGWLRSLGGAVRYRQADVTDQAALASLAAELRAAGTPLRGVIHAAGVIKDGPAAAKTPDVVREVLAPKVAGTIALDAATAAEDLDFFVLFSSVVGTFGNRGQADYAYANAFLDAFAAMREQSRLDGERRGRTLAIGWPLWQAGGMSVDPAAALRLRRQFGMVPMRTEAGLAAFERLLAGDTAVAVVVEIDTGSETGTVQADHRPQAQPGQATTDNTAEVLAVLRGIAAEFLLVDPDEVDTAAQLLDLGFDSISMTDLISRLNVHYGLDLLPTVLFEHPTLAALAEHLGRRQARNRAAVVIDERAPRPAEPDGPVARPGRDVAVIGMAGIMPRSADLTEFWRHLAAGADLVGPVPADRTDLLADPRTRDMVGGFIDGVAEFDAEMFGIAPREAALMDPQQRLFLRTVFDAFADAGYRPASIAATATGMFAGVSTSDYNDLVSSAGVPVRAHMATGLSHAVLANRVSHLLDLRGPSEAVDTACSSALVAIHRAVRALRAGECELAVAGGVNVLLTPGLFVAFSEAGMLSPTGRCRTFDRAADGYVRGEGAGAVVLKLLDRALADGDTVHAVIKGTAVNHGGRAASLTAPNPRAQAEVIAAGYLDAGIDMSTVDYLEAHGTGTRLGDPVEIEGIKEAFRLAGSAPWGTVLIGSVKTNIGHLEAAAGIAGLLKVLLAIRHRQLPPHLHLTVLNPHVRLSGTALEVNQELRPWPADRTRVAGVSSFGFGGSNAHVVLAAPSTVDAQARVEPVACPAVLPLSAPDGRRLADYASELADLLAAGGHHIDQVAYTLQVGRPDYPRRLAVVAADSAGAVDALRAAAAGRAPDLGGDEPASLAADWVAGAAVDWASRWPHPAGRVSLPSARPARTRHWFTDHDDAEPASTVESATVNKVRAVVADVLGVAADTVAPDVGLDKLGLDSIFALDLAARLSATFGTELAAAELFEHDTVTALATLLATQRNPGPVTAADPVRDAVQRALRRPFDPSVGFEDNGLTSLEMLRVVSELEHHLGVLPKTLLFEQPDLASLRTFLTERCGSGGLDSLAAGAVPDTPPAPAVGRGAGGTVLSASEAVAGETDAAASVAELTARYGAETGLADADIAPLIYLAADRTGYLRFAAHPGAVLAWRYVGPDDAISEVVGEFADYAAAQARTVTVLSPVPLDDIGGSRFTATPFGVVQQLDELAGFRMDGGAMSRLRGRVNRVAKTGRCEVVEYRSGTDSSIDARIVEVVDWWAAGKPTVSRYVHTVRAAFAQGRLDAAHRVFLTLLDGKVEAATVITEMPAEHGYLLDVECYTADLPAGGMDYTVVRIIETLRDEGVRVFSFGATFGVPAGDAPPNSSPQAELALAELRSAGLGGDGNYQFKRRFRPRELPIYLCQPGAAPTGVAEVLLMIAGQTEPAGSPARGDAGREAALAAAGWNVLRLAGWDVDVDLLTDSWAERDDVWIAPRMDSLSGKANGENLRPPWLPLRHVVPAPSGRAAEALLCRAWPGRRGLVLHNGLFPTLLFNLADQRFTPRALPHAGSQPGDISIAALTDAIAEAGGDVAAIAIELSGNAHGGAPVSVAGLAEVAKLARDNGIALILDATRLVDNCLVVTGEHRDPFEIARDMLDMADAAVLSLTKDFGVTVGGIVATSRADLAERLEQEVRLRGTDVGLASRRLMHAALADVDWVTTLVRQRIDAVRVLWRTLSERGVPVVAPPGTHCVLLDVDRMPAFAGLANPAASCLAWIYRGTGVRAAPHLSDDPRLASCIRLAVPVGMPVAQAEDVGERLATLFAAADAPVDLGRVGDDVDPRSANYRPAGEPNQPGWFHQQLTELGGTLRGPEYAPADENLAVLREFAPAAEVRLVPDRDGQAEVFTLGAGPVLVLMHPFNIGAGVFGPQFAGLADRFQVVVIHQPGVGRTSVDTELTLAAVTALQRRVLTGLGLAPPFHVGGASVGSIFAEYFTLTYPRDTATLSIIGGSYKFANRKGQIDKLDQVVAEDFEAILSGSGSTRVPALRDRVTNQLLRCESMDPRVGLRYLDMFAGGDMTARLADIEVPTLVVQGRHDSVVGVKTGHFMHGAIPNSRYVELPDSGHFVCLTDPDAVNETMSAFLLSGGDLPA